MRVKTLFVLVLVALAAPRPARACSHPAISQAPYLHFPAPGSTGVPTNLVLTIYRSTFEDTLSGFVLRDDLAATVATSHTRTASWGTGDLGTVSYRVTPAAPLAPATHYEIVATVDGAEQLMGGFTTGDGPDDDAPAAPAVSVTKNAPHHCVSGFQCCEVEPRIADLELALPPTDERLAYSLLAGETVVAQDLPAPLTGMVVCAGRTPSFRNTAGPDRLPDFLVGEDVHELTLVARDLAGHESAPVTVAIAVDCARVDEGTGPLPPTTPGSPDGGCAVAGSDGGAGLWLVALLALAARRRRR